MPIIICRADEDARPTPGLRDALDSSLRPRSLVYTWVAESFKLRFPSLAAKAAHRPNQDEIYSARTPRSETSGYDTSPRRLEFPGDWDLDSMFARRPRPRIQ